MAENQTEEAYDPTDPDVIYARARRERMRKGLRVRLWIILLGVTIGLLARSIDETFVNSKDSKQDETEEVVPKDKGSEK